MVAVGRIRSPGGAANELAGATRRIASPIFLDATEEERGDTDVLIASIRNVQARAKGKYEENNPSRLKSYFVGAKLASRGEIEQVGNTVYDLVRTIDEDGNPIAPQDSLPGLTAGAIAMFETNLDIYTGVQTKQGKAQKFASSSRQSFKEQCDQVGRRRRKIQFAIEAEYPPSAETAGQTLRLAGHAGDELGAFVLGRVTHAAGGFWLLHRRYSSQSTY